jgi:soluble lytic murein transglycosylase-like protein
VWKLLILAAPALWSQTNPIQDAMAESLGKQRASIEKQKDAARLQAARAVPMETSSNFFTVPWPKPVQMLPAECDALPRDQIENLIKSASAQEAVRPDLLREVMYRESAFRPCAVSVRGAQGLMQLMPGTALELGVKNPFDPAENVAGGAKFLKQLLSKYQGDVSLALAAYNAGPGAVDAASGIPEKAETKSYVAEIMKRLIF